MTSFKNINIVYREDKDFGYHDTRNDNLVTKQILEPKRPPIAEIELTLFENCNIVCDFCYHDKNSVVGMNKEEIFSKLEIIESFIKDRAGTVELFQFNMVGGELFQDRLLDEYLPIYFDFCVELNAICFAYDVRYEIVWVTNFLFKEREKILHFINRLNCGKIPSTLICSYDFEGRPTNNIYYKNIQFLENNISSINIVATTETIKSLMKNEDDFFSDYLYVYFPIYIDDFIPDDGHDTLIPSDKELLDFYIFIHQEYPDVYPVKEWVENTNNKMHCLSLNKITIFPDNSTSNCKWHRYKPKNFITYKDTKINYLDNAPQMQRFMDENGCLSCKYFSRCGFRCYTQWDWATRKRDLDDCLMRMFFNYVTKDD